MQEVHNSDDPREMRLPTPFVQKFLLAFAFVLGIVIVLALPFLAFQEAFFPLHHASTQVARNVYSLPTVPHTPVVNPTLQPVGTTILPSTGRIMIGISATDDPDSVNTFETRVSKKMSVILLYQSWGDDDANFPVDWVNVVRAHGSLPMITWEPWVTAVYPAGNDEPAYTLSNLIAGNFDSYITQWADAAKAWKSPFFLRFAPEMNGNWNPWSEGLNGNTAGQYVQAWRHVHDIFTSRGVTNATWVWCPNIEFRGEPPFPLSEYYPGDAYVDWTAMDGFNWGTATKDTVWNTFAQVFSQTYNHILSITANKPLMIAEIGCVEQGGNKAEWITDAYSVELNNFPAIKAMVWFDQHTQQDWRIESSEAATRAFSQAVQSPIFAANIFANYNGG